VEERRNNNTVAVMGDSDGVSVANPFLPGNTIGSEATEVNGDEPDAFAETERFDHLGTGGDRHAPARREAQPSEYLGRFRFSTFDTHRGKAVQDER
jgi:hypothetical protein